MLSSLLLFGKLLDLSKEINSVHSEDFVDFYIVSKKSSQKKWIDRNLNLGRSINRSI